MKFGYTIIYVPDVAASLEFFEKALGLSRRFLHESGNYGELETGETTLAFASHTLAESNFKSPLIHVNASSNPVGIEIAFFTSNVTKAHEIALAAGATELAAPKTKPWGQLVSYIRCPAGILIELCTPIGA